MSQRGPETAVGGVSGDVLCAGEGRGEILWLDEPLSFWGGTDLASGVITDVHHPQRGVALAGRVVVMSASRGSSSSSSVLAEQLRAGVGPAAVLLTTRDLIVALGALAAAEVYGIRMPIVLLNSVALATLPRSGSVTVNATDPVTSGTAFVVWSGRTGV
jgi:predicted aconitase with swiveling domain